jgi:hypothetical protein
VSTVRKRRWQLLRDLRAVEVRLGRELNTPEPMLALSEWESWRRVARSFPRARNTTGTLNTASGVHALVSNTTGYNNTADGAGAAFNNTTGHDDIAHG